MNDRHGRFVGWAVRREMARHLRIEHGWGIRRIGRRLGLSDAEVKRALDEQ